MDSGNSLDYRTESIYSLSDFTLSHGEQSFPTLELDSVTMMGDYMARNAPKFNTFTKFEVKLDLVSIEREAYLRATKFFDDFKNDEDYTVTFAKFECDPETLT